MPHFKNSKKERSRQISYTSTYTFIFRGNYPPMYRTQCSTQETHSTWQHIPHWAPPNTTLPRHNGGRASTFITNGNPVLTTLLTKGIQPNKKEPQLHKHIANTTATNYSYYLPLWPCTHQPTGHSLPRPTSKACTAYTRYPPRYQKEDTQPNRKSATYAPDSNHRHCCFKLTNY